MKQYKVVLSGEARNMLKSHLYYLAAVNPGAARALQRKLMGEIRSLAKMPERFPFLDGTGPFRKLFAPNWYLVFYLVEGDTVFVEYIIDGRQDYRWLLS